MLFDFFLRIAGGVELDNLFEFDELNNLFELIELDNFFEFDELERFAGGVVFGVRDWGVVLVERLVREN